MPFIVSSYGQKPDSNSQKLIRSHVMRGKNRGKGPRRKNKSREDTGEVEQLRADVLKKSGVLLIRAYSHIPERVGTDLSSVHFADKIEPNTVAMILDCKYSVRY